MLIIILGQIVCRVEKWEKFDGLYWSFITATTVGYGDIRPLKKGSKALSVLIALVGMMFTGIIVAVTLNTTSVALDKHIDERVIEKIKDKFG
ncbi:MAG: two pore domain potassium channel family protein [Methylococcales bacterium]|nr:two pore domain potassium channel family protein [Methylococcales bacterium]